MNKYGLVFSTSLKEEKEAILDAVLNAIGFVLIMFIMVQLWRYIYGESGANSVINGYTLEQMLWYLLATESIVSCAKQKAVTSAISKEIKTGSIAYKMNKPYNFYLYNIVNFSAKSVWDGMFIIPVALIVGFIGIGFVDSFTIYQIIPSLLTFFSSCILISSMYGIIGLISFWVEDSTPFTWILQKFLMLFGLLFPLEFFPSFIQPFIMYSPIYSIYSGPAKLVANFSFELFLQVLISQIVWIAIFTVLGLVLYNRGKKKVNVNGG